MKHIAHLDIEPENMDFDDLLKIADGRDNADQCTYLKVWQHLWSTGMAISLGGQYTRRAFELIDEGKISF